ncbi:MAG: LytR C-terminal domain-containing protein [Candidatus Moranbacteria bacterium]|nr:LytR C-terminal domain-containing protein [Candidatus Moranbacteria bacterium]MBP7696026.1 LytR C-terminal domain-containing protein [Candidatus Moranbacteria bacterium]
MEETELASKDDVIAAGDHHPAKRHTSREGWYGAGLLGGVVLLGCLLVGGSLWWLYTRVYLEAREEKSSIRELSGSIAVDATETGKTSETVVPVAMPSAPVASEATAVSDVKQETIAVLNGGGIKGSAGTVAALLKQDGYVTVTTGNTTKDYTGVVVYHAADKALSAAAVVKSLLKQYPKAVSKEAPKTDAEASSGAIVVIIGK